MMEQAGTSVWLCTCLQAETTFPGRNPVAGGKLGTGRSLWTLAKVLALTVVVGRPVVPSLQRMNNAKEGQAA